MSNRPGASVPGRSPFQSPAVIGGLAALGMIGAVGYFAVLKPKADAKNASKPLAMLLGADITTSVTPELRTQCFKVVNSTINNELQPGTAFTIWTYDVNTREVAQPHPQDARELKPVEEEIIHQVSKTTGTYPSEMLKKMLASAQEAANKGENVACLLLTDGEDTDAAHTKPVAKELAAMPNVKAIWIMGVKPDNGFRSLLKETYSPFGDRVVMSGAFDAQAGQDKFRELIERK